MKFDYFVVSSKGASVELKKTTQRDMLEISFSDFFEVTFESDGCNIIKPIEWLLKATDQVSLKVDLINAEDLVFSTVWVSLPTTEYTRLGLPLVSNTKKLVVSLAKLDNVNANSKVFILSDGPNVIEGKVFFK